MEKKATKLLSFFLLLLIFGTCFANAKAYSTGFDTIDGFRANSIDVYQNIEVNYTIIGTGGSSITTIKNSGGMVDTVRFHNPLRDQLMSYGGALTTQTPAELGSEDRWEFLPETQAIFMNDFQSMMRWDWGVYSTTNTTVVQTQTFFNGTQNLNDIGQYYFNQNGTVNMDKTQQTGILYSTILLPAEDIALDWGKKNNAIINSIDNITTEIVGNTEFVDFLTIQQSVPMIPDTNLQDGYDIIPVNASDFGISWIIGIAIAFFIVALGVDILLNDDPIFDFSTNVVYSADQTLNVNWSTPEFNDTELYNMYLDFASTIGVEPTVEGYYEWSRERFANIQAISPELPAMTMSNNWSTQGGASQNGITGIFGFIGDLLPIIIAALIIGAFAIAMIWMVRKANIFGSKD